MSKQASADDREQSPDPEPPSSPRSDSSDNMDDGIDASPTPRRGRSLGGGRVFKSRVPTNETTTTTLTDSTASSGLSSRQLELEQEVAKLLSVAEHQQATIRDLENTVFSQRAILESLNPARGSTSSSQNNSQDTPAVASDNKDALNLADLETKHSTTPAATIDALRSQNGELYELRKSAGQARAELDALARRHAAAQEELARLRRVELTAARYRRKIDELQAETGALRREVAACDERQICNGSEGVAAAAEDLREQNRALSKALEDARVRELQLLSLVSVFEDREMGVDGSGNQGEPRPLNIRKRQSLAPEQPQAPPQNPVVHPGSAASSVSSATSSASATSTSAPGINGIRPLINHYEVLVKKAGYSAARWRMIMSRSASASASSSPTKTSPRKPSGAYGEETGELAQAFREMAARRRRVSGESAVVATAAQDAAQDAALPEQHVVRRPSNESVARRASSESVATRWAAEESESEGADHHSEPEDAAATATADPAKPQEIVNASPDESVARVERWAREVEAQNAQLKHELELMATAWQSLAQKFQEQQQQQQQQQQNEKEEEIPKESKKPEKCPQANSASSSSSTSKARAAHVRRPGRRRAQRSASEGTWLALHRGYVLGYMC